MTDSVLPALSLLETRVLGVLLEKERTVPDSYPMTLNALASGCNQKTSRDPILNATDAEIQATVDRLKTLSLVFEASGARVARYSHNAERMLRVPSQACAILTILMLRGPQTAGELRINTERLHRFADLSAVEGFLEELREPAANRPAWVVELPRQAGARENRWAHLLSGPVSVETMADAGGGSNVSLGEMAALKANVARLDAEVAGLKATVAQLCTALGVDMETGV